MKNFLSSTVSFIKSISNDYSKRSLSAYSAQAAFFLFVSFFPFAAIVFYFISFIPALNGDVFPETAGLIPQLLIEIFFEAKNQLTESNNLLILLISGVTALWSASKGIHAISEGLNSAYSEEKPKGAIKLRLRSTLYTLFFVVVIIAVLGLLVFGNVLHEELSGIFPKFAGTLFILNSFKFLFLLLILVGFFAVTYKFLPNRKTKLSQVLIGATIASVGWLVYSFVYSLYIDNYNITNSVYGSLATIVLLMLWLYSCMNILLFGALLNARISYSKINSGS